MLLFALLIYMVTAMAAVHIRWIVYKSDYLSFVLLVGIQQLLVDPKTLFVKRTSILCCVD
jgi:hypothetical protein